MAYRVNVMFNNPTWDLLRKVPQGERSQMINQAVLAWFQQGRRVQAAQAMDRLRKRLPRFKTAQIVNWIRQDRRKIS